LNDKIAGIFEAMVLAVVKKRATQVFLGFPTQQHFTGLMQEVMQNAILAAHPSFS
jgi:hypothetical protein